jgi:hypothetical protein
MDILKLSRGCKNPSEGTKSAGSFWRAIVLTQCALVDAKHRLTEVEGRNHDISYDVIAAFALRHSKHFSPFMEPENVGDCVHKTPPLVSIWKQLIHCINFHPISIRLILILSFHLRLRLPGASSIQVFLP